MFRRISLFALACLAPLGVAAQSGNWTVGNYQQTILMDVAMINSQVGYITGAQNGYGPNVLKTTDGGNTWNQLQTAPSGGAMFFISTAAESEESVVISGVSMLSGAAQYSTNGNTFTSSKEPGVYIEQALGASTINGTDGGFALFGQFNIAKQSATAALAVSYDGGQTYRYINNGNSYSARGGAFPNATTWYLAQGQWGNSSSASQRTRDITHRVHADGTLSLHHTRLANDDGNGYAGQIMKTTDAGETWSQVFTSNTVYMIEMACPTVDLCYVVADGPSNSYVYKSEDAGATWNVVLAAENAALTVLTALSQDELWVAGGGNDAVIGYAFYSNDGGSTWTNQTVEGNTFTAMSFVGSDFAVATAISADEQSTVLVYSA